MWQDNGDGSLYQPLPALKGPDGTQMVGMNSLTRDGGFAISKKCKNPEALFVGMIISILLWKLRLSGEEDPEA